MKCKNCGQEHPPVDDRYEADINVKENDCSISITREEKTFIRDLRPEFSAIIATVIRRAMLYEEFLDQLPEDAQKKMGSPALVEQVVLGGAPYGVAVVGEEPSAPVSKEDLN